MSNHKGRYRQTRKPRNPFYLLAALAAAGMLLLVGACADTEADAPEDFPVNAERRSSGDAAPEPAPEPVVDEPDPMSDEAITRLAIEITFDEASAAEMADMCDAVDVLGMDTAVGFYAEGWGPSWKDSYGPMVASELRERC